MLASEFMTKYDVTGDVEFVTDFDEDTPYGLIPRREWAVTLTHQGQSFTSPIATGTAGIRATVEGSLYCIGSNAKFGAMDLDEFLNKLGGDDTELKRKAWRECKAVSDRVRAWVSSDAMWDDLRTIDEP
jgi:hypothetical protein